ncbi:polysaccharide deacetylase family protein [Embleya sp. NBC_00896]|uniref:polysaccharide deacetylase family protein n=1 Tax=Embleya sp. NBC_00896 TaxID=2975961 RepID=UPI0038673228|nr:polysaccharide deacetylase family protein [Embleya sp. NBC_00896]
MRFQAVVAALSILVCGALIWNVASAGRWSQAAAGPRAADAPKEIQAPLRPPGNPNAQEPATPPAAPALPVDPTLVSKVKGEGKVVALTLDDGPWPEWTDKALALLARYDVKATFCMVGQQAKDHPALVRKVVAGGHGLCNHSMTHDTALKTKSPDEIRAQMQGTLDAIHAASPGTPVPWFRAPGGNWSDEVRQTAASLGMRSMHWTVDTNDWQKPGVGKMLEAVDKQLGPRGIILCHDGGGDRTQTIAMLDRLIPDLKAAGYTFIVP